MAIKNTNLGGTDWVNNETLTHTDLNDTFNETLKDAVPIGTILSWLKSFTGTPALPYGWVECNGQEISDADSLYDGETLPDLNGDNRFLRGNSTSGGTGGTATNDLSHTHSLSTSGTVGGGTGNYRLTSSTTNSSLSSTTDNEPPYYNIVWIVKIK